MTLFESEYLGVMLLCAAKTVNQYCGAAATPADWTSVAADEALTPAETRLVSTTAPAETSTPSSANAVHAVELSRAG